MSNSSDNSAKRITISNLGQMLCPDNGQEKLVNKFSAVRYRDAYLLPRDQGEAWLFDYGILVCWNLEENDRQQLIHALQDVIVEASARPVIEQYRYTVSESGNFSLNHDCLELPDGEPLTRLALSHAFAQSEKLDFFESQAQKVIQDNAYISKQLAKHGKVALSRRMLSKLRGILFDTSSDIALHFNLLDTPEFFWEYPELEAYYQRVYKYLDIGPRLTVLNKKLETIQNLLDMLATEQNHKHSAFLEWVIIILIAVDILVYFLEPAKMGA